MKKCSYYGRENADEALNCKECGTEFKIFIEAENPKSAGGEFQNDEKI
jgi:hypothetical protein